jgi:hypothetical protein
MVKDHPYPDSRCASCEGEKLIVGARSTFVMCLRLPNKYPQQPVLACEAYVAREAEVEDA